MSSIGTQDLQKLCEGHGLLAAVLLLKSEPVVWMGSFNQSDYSHLLLLSQTQSLPILSPSLDAVQFSSQPVMVYSQFLSDKTLALLVLPFEIRLKEMDRRAEAFLKAIEVILHQAPLPSLLDGLRVRQVESVGSANDNLLALFSGMPEADPSNDATQPFRMSKVAVQTLEKSVDNWKPIF